MLEQNIFFESAGLRLAGVMHAPDDLAQQERRAAFIVLHGFGSNKDAGNVRKPCALLHALGYITLRFDMRGCGESEGTPGHILCLDQVEDTRSARAWLADHPSVAPGQIAVLGSSFGAAVAVYAAAIDTGFAAVISSGGWGNGARKFRGQHRTAEAWAKFVKMLADGRRHLAETGQSMMVGRYDIVPIPSHLSGHIVDRSIQTFSVETAQSMFDFCAENLIEQISPRPILLLHSAADSVTPTEQSIEMFRRAGQPTDLHLFAETDHFMFADDNTRVQTVLTGWLERYFPARANAISPAV